MGSKKKSNTVYHPAMTVPELILLCNSINIKVFKNEENELDLNTSAAYKSNNRFNFWTDISNTKKIQ